jgi:hypothetical protein
LGEAPGVGAVVVVVDEVGVEVLCEGGGLGDQRAGERRAPALFADGALDALDAAVAVGPAGADEALPATEALDVGTEVLGAELRAVVGI